MAVKVYALGPMLDAQLSHIGRQPVFWICDTVLELPVTNLVEGDLLITRDTDGLYLATSTTTTALIGGLGLGPHPDLATHDALGLATDAELSTHAGAADPHTGYLTETAHGGTSPTGHHAQQHSATSAPDHTFPGGTSTFLRADGSFAAPTAQAADLDKPETGALTVATAKYHMTGVRHSATGSQRLTVAGTGRWRVLN